MNGSQVAYHLRVNKYIDRQMFVESLDTDGLGVGAHSKDGKIRFAYPVAVLVAER